MELLRTQLIQNRFPQGESRDQVPVSGPGINNEKYAPQQPSRQTLHQQTDHALQIKNRDDAMDVDVPEPGAHRSQPVAAPTAQMLPQEITSTPNKPTEPSESTVVLPVAN